MYLEDGSLNVVTLGRGYTWFDTGTMDSLFEAAELVRVVEKSQHMQIASVEEIEYRNKWISLEMLQDLALRYGNSPYGEYLKRVANDEIYTPKRDD